MYDLYTQVVNNNYSSLRFWRPSPDEIGIPPTKIEASIQTKGPLTASEINPSAENSGSILTVQNPGMNFSFLNQSQPEQLLILTTSYWAREDYNDLKAIVANMKVRYGSSLNGVNTFTKSKISAFDKITTYKYMSTGNYDVKFTTRHINGSANSLSPIIVTKTFNYPQTFTIMQFMTF
jgi:hypothetical protein